jgi:cation:H+ antiporter
VVVVQATVAGYPGLVLGNVVGSNIANVLLVTGAAAAVYPLTYGEHSVRRDSVFMIGATILLVLLGRNGFLSLADGAVLLIALAGVTALTAREAARAYREAELKPPMEWVLGLPQRLLMIVLFILLGAAGLPLGAHLVVDASVEIANHLGVSETVIGLSILAIGTSLPELATTLMAAVQKRTEVAIGTVVGSNLFNILAIMGVGAVIAPSAIVVPGGFFTLDFPVMLGAALVLSVFVWLKRPVGKPAGFAFLAAYAAYLVILFMRNQGAAY